jgi:hypothetical protein
MHVEVLDNILEKFDFLTDVFTRAQLKDCLLLIFGTCLSPTKTVNGMAGWLEGINQSTLNRFLTQYPWNAADLFDSYHKRIKENVVGKVVRLIIDDSKIAKTGENIERVGWEFDHCKKLSVLCFSIVFSIVKIDGFELPLPFAAEACRKKQGKKRKKSKITIAMRIISDFISIAEKAAKRIILFDSWYCAAKLIKSIPNGVYWVTRLKFKKSRLVRLDGCWLPIWKFCKGVNSWRFRGVKINGRSFWVYTEKLEVHGLGEVTVVISKLKRHSRKYLVFISNLDDAKEILEEYDGRWDIETFFRTAKQNLGIGDVQMRKYLGNRRYWSVVLLAYSSISFLQRLWRKSCRTAGEVLDTLRRLLQNAAADYGMSLGRFTHAYVCEKIAKL